jgi:four helix bundle protein
MDLVEEIYQITVNFPEREKYGLVSQMRRSAVSIPSNLAEGAARSSDAEFTQFIHVALGSCSELDTQLEICYRLGYLSTKTWQPLSTKLQEISCMLIGLRNSLKKKNKRKEEGQN